MKTSNLKKCMMGVLLAGLVIMLGCRPSVHDVIEVISKVPLGTNRAEIWNVLVKAYPNEVYPYQLTTPAHPVTEGMIKADNDLIAVSEKEGLFTYIYPSDLYKKMPAKAFEDRFGSVAEASEGNGGFSIFYDSNTNYIGFFAYSTEKVR
jgi:hypothetical protein